MDKPKRTMDEILKDVLPKKSSNTYVKAWNDFETCTGRKEKYEEEDFIVYFDYLRNHKEYKTSTMWKCFSLLNETYKLRNGCRLQNKFHRMYMILKSYNSCYERKSVLIFTHDSIIKLFQNIFK